MIYRWIQELISYGIQQNLMVSEDIIYTVNRLCEKLKLDGFEGSYEVIDKRIDPIEVLDKIVGYAYDKKLITSPNPPFSDLFDTALMDLLMPRPSEVNKEFFRLYKQSPKLATDYYYKLSQDSHYIRMDRVKKNIQWQTDSAYGVIDITVNLSKPEKDPKAIAMGQHQLETGYPKCLLCYENVGYQGHINHPARQNHRVIPLTLQNEQWYLQYSPYVYFNEHSIVFKGSHDPMKISEGTYKRLLDFVEWMPHYFIGSNADLPIVGGSMLSHDHYQSGCAVFPMEKASVKESFKLKKYGDIQVSWLNWPLSVLRLSGNNKETLIACATEITTKWRRYSDIEVDILAYSDNTPHNTVTPIARRNQNNFEIDLVLRNNRSSSDHPDGIFHPHTFVHPVKKENIGLIEVMGLAVLPSRLKDQMMLLTEALENDWALEKVEENDDINRFTDLYQMMRQHYSETKNAESSVKTIVGQIFIKGLEHAGVYKLDDAGRRGINRFIAHMNQ